MQSGGYIILLQTIQSYAHRLRMVRKLPHRHTYKEVPSKNRSHGLNSFTMGIIDSYGIERDIRTSLATLTEPFSHTNPIGCTMSILRLHRWWEGVMPFRRLWLNLTRSFGTILRRGRMATVYPAGVVGRHLLSVVLGADVHHGCCR